MRYLVALLFILAVAVGGGLIYRELTLGPPLVLPAPTRLQVQATGSAIAPNGWTNSRSLDLSVALVRDAGIDVEVRPVGQGFSDSPTESSDAVQVASTCSGCRGHEANVAQVRLDDGVYHWQARLHGGRGVSPWVVAPSVVRIDSTPPAITALVSPTDPNPKAVYHTSSMTFTWQGHDGGSGVAGYAYRLDTTSNGTPTKEIRTAKPDVTLSGLNTGQYYFHASPLDNAGNWGPVVTFPVRIDVTPPGLTHVTFSLFQFDPDFDQLHVSFGVTRPAREVRVGVYRQQDNYPIRIYKLTDLKPGGDQTVTWDGKGVLGHDVNPGAYQVYIRAIDQYGHSTVTGWRDFIVTYKRIVVSLSQQKLWAYDGNSLFLTSLVTTGNRALPTPTGTYHILAKFHPFTFRSPWPKSSPYYYPPSLTQWSMLFREGGYFVHDAPWRTVFGPGSNGQLGKPGDNYTGTHGCVNVPSDVANKLYHWAEIGTIVQVNP